MDLTNIIIGSVAGITIGVILMKLISAKANHQLLLEKAKLEERDRFSSEELLRLRSLLESERRGYENNLSEERELGEQTRLELVAMRENLKSQQLRVEEQRAEIDEMHKKFSLQFENIAGKLLEEKSQKFTEQNQVNITRLLDPLKEKLTDFEKRVEKTYDQELRDKISLKEEVKKLFDLNQKISEEANNLTRALKSDTKKQGNWGEFVLERVLERSGLIEGESYTLQAKGMGLTGSDGNRYQPDVIIHLPEQKHLIVDAKVSLIAYEQWVNADDEDQRERFGRSHLNSLRNHVIELSNKNYPQLNGVNSPEFVLLFVPVESSFSMAVQTDNDLFSFAWDKKVVIVSPSTLLATLRTVASVWKQEKQNRNVMEIARLSGDMYDKFVGFVGDMEMIDKNLRQSKDSFDKAMNKLSSGRGNLTVTAEKLKTLGAKTSKQLDEKYLNE
ncbi:DNA recombination protein RmuC [Solitalea sp. MAHUQ-68]|uniref:DNA recombination protein RmuC n=1 Tax=Solitalea agri TaxID=2953739 RepID=A0A9X2F6E2_9SPHI|nr:DNA recombination protein RmuC [Solitalea agri]MCO4292728.1 DNA recombination protein RmuC [Solitalea agri]